MRQHDKALWWVAISIRKNSTRECGLDQELMTAVPWHLSRRQEKAMVTHDERKTDITSRCQPCNG